MDKRGMTLIELLVAVGIILVLASIAMAQYSKAREPAKDQSRRENCRQEYIGMLSEDPQHIPLGKQLMSGGVYYDFVKKSPVLIREEETLAEKTAVWYGLAIYANDPYSR